MEPRKDEKVPQLPMTRREKILFAVIVGGVSILICVIFWHQYSWGGADANL